MMFSKEDFKVHDVGEMVEFVPIVIFIGLVGPFLAAAYTIGFIMDVTGWLKKA